MSYAVRNDRLGWRAVGSSNDINDDEFYSDIQIDICSTSIRDDIERQRLIAYADPITGSDRYFAEASRLTAMSAPAEDIANATAAGIARAAEIAAMYPWPDDGDTA